MTTAALVQARMGSTRLPGKVMLSLDCTPVIQHVVRRTAAAETVDDVVVATTDKQRDDIIERYAKREGADIVRGDETNVLERMYRAATAVDADTVVRITADNPLLSPEAIDAGVRKRQQTDVDYVSNKLDSTFPAGLDVEVFTAESFETVKRQAADSHDREHVTPPYRESDEFTTATLRSVEVFEKPFMQNRTDLRLTLDTPDDYELFTRIYAALSPDPVIDVREAVIYVDEEGLAELNTD